MFDWIGWYVTTLLIIKLDYLLPCGAGPHPRFMQKEKHQTKVWCFLFGGGRWIRDHFTIALTRDSTQGYSSTELDYLLPCGAGPHPRFMQKEKHQTKVWCFLFGGGRWIRDHFTIALTRDSTQGYSSTELDYLLPCGAGPHHHSEQNKKPSQKAWFLFWWGKVDSDHRKQS